MNEYFLFYQSPIGWLKLCSGNESLISIDFVEVAENLTADFVPQILLQTALQLTEYFKGDRLQFELPHSPDGTPFQQLVWRAVEKVRFGKTKNYGEIARELGSSKFSRAVGMANGKNPLPIIIPCHRIIGFNGKMTGYSGGIERKKWLLLHEQRCLGKVLF